jgi:hypothetical protein
MAIVKFETFPTDAAENNALRAKVTKALTGLCGHGPSAENKVISAPRNLKAERDLLRGDYREIWKLCSIEYSEDESGASANHRTNQIKLGPVFLRPFFSAKDIEKVILHEFLHLVLAETNRDFHHSLITQIIQFNIGYQGEPNPASCS